MLVRKHFTSCPCRNIKASSPRLNIVIIIGSIFLMPVTLTNVMTLSAGKYNIPKNTMDVLCQVGIYIAATVASM